MENQNQDEIKRLFNLNSDELLQELVIDIGTLPSLGAKPISKIEANKRQMESWLKRNRMKLCKAIGESKKVGILLKQGNVSDRVELAAAIADAIAIVYGGIPVIRLSVFLVQRGIRQICEGEPSWVK